MLSRLWHGICSMAKWKGLLRMKVKSLSEQVYDYIYRLIRTGKLKYNDKIDDVALVEELGVSRTPIREALIQLSSDGLLTSRPRKGFFVREQSEEEMNQAFNVIACLDCYALELAVQCTDLPQLIRSMRSCIEKIDIAIQEQDYEKYYDWQEAFHLMYQEKCQNQILQNELSNLLRRWLRMTYYCSDAGKLFDLLRVINGQHKSIVDAVEKGDLNRAKELLKDHWTRSYTPEGE